MEDGRSRALGLTVEGSADTVETIVDGYRRPQTERLGGRTRVTTHGPSAFQGEAFPRSSRRAASTMWLALIPAASSSSSGVPEPGSSATAR
jgi:hypothetical protein